jgi:hypothetical protein
VIGTTIRGGCCQVLVGQLQRRTILLLNAVFSTTKNSDSFLANSCSML